MTTDAGPDEAHHATAGDLIAWGPDAEKELKKIPFFVPTDPLVRARSLALEAEGKNPFKLCTPLANKMAFTVACAVASAAITVSNIMSAGVVSAQVAMANKVSPSKVV